MPSRHEQILLVEQDQKIVDLLLKQILTPLGYQVKWVVNVAEAIKETLNGSFDLVITNLDLAGLSGNDLLVAFTAQNIETPVIVLAKKGMEQNINKAFRLGAADYLSLPVRETEVVSVVERVLNQIRANRQREQQNYELKQSNLELQQRLRGMATTLMTGKKITSITDVNSLYAEILEGALSVTEADYGWLLMRKDRGKNFLVTAHQGKCNDSTTQIQTLKEGNHSLEDIIESTQAGEDEQLASTELSKSKKPILVAPIHSHQVLIGLLVMMRAELRPFSSNQKTCLEAIANYASLSITKLRLFQMVKGQIKGFFKGKADQTDTNSGTDRHHQT